MQIIERFATNCPCYKNNQAAKALYDSGDDTRYWRFQCRGPRGLMLHSVGCSQPRADVFATRWDRADNHNAITHAVLQADGTVYQLLPWNYRAWHCGGSANDTHIGVEMTEPDTIRYPDDGGANFTVLDLEAARAQARGTYATARDLFAYLCDRYGLDPMTDIISHNEGGKRGIASTHVDPEHLWRGLGMDYTMDGFRKDVKARMEAMETPETKPVPEPEKPKAKVIYRVQVGAFTVKENADAFLKEVQDAGFENAFITKVEPEESYKVRVTVAIGLNVRSGPGTEYPADGALEYGDEVKIIKEKDGWGQVSSGGWISLDYTEKI